MRDFRAGVLTSSPGRRLMPSGPLSVTRRVASFPGVGLGAQLLPLPDHRLDHRVWRLQLLGHVVLLDQTVHDALAGGRGQRVTLGPATLGAFQCRR